MHYLKEVLDRPGFHMILLTHNFDFLRTIIRRGIVSGKQACFVDKKPNKTTLLRAKVPDSPLDAFVANLEKPSSLVASIPFARNIVEYTRGAGDGDYLELTRLLHWRDGTGRATVGALLDVLGRTFPKAKLSGKRRGARDGKVFDAIISEADRHSREHKEGELEAKIVLSVATRLLAERLLVERLLGGRAPPVEKRISIHGWIAEHKRSLEEGAAGEGRPLTGQEARELEVLDDVALMTPETIHINSFMYEPILDMSGGSLAELYRAVRSLDGEAGGA